MSQRNPFLNYTSFLLEMISRKLRIKCTSSASSLRVSRNRPIAKLRDRAFAKHENEAYCVKTKNSLYFYMRKVNFRGLKCFFCNVFDLFLIFRARWYKPLLNTRFFLWYNLLLLSHGEKQQNIVSQATKNNEIWRKTKSMNKFNKDLHIQKKNIEKNEEITIKARLKHSNSLFDT